MGITVAYVGLCPPMPWTAPRVCITDVIQAKRYGTACAVTSVAGIVHNIKFNMGWMCIDMLNLHDNFM